MTMTSVSETERESKRTNRAESPPDAAVDRLAGLLPAEGLGRRPCFHSVDTERPALSTSASRLETHEAGASSLHLSANRRALQVRPAVLTA